MTYSEIKEGEFFIINDIKSLPKRKTADGYIDLVTGNTERDIDIPDILKNEFSYEVIDRTELEYWKSKLNLTFVA